MLLDIENFIDRSIYIKVSMFNHSGHLLAEIKIPFNEDIKNEIYESLENAIENIGIKQKNLKNLMRHSFIA